TLAIVVQNPHVKALGATCDGLPNAPHPADPKRSAVDITPCHEQQGPVAPLPSPDVAVALGNTAGDATEQAPGEVGSGFGHHPWRVGDEDAALRRRCHIDIVIPHSDIRHYFESRS